MGIVAGFGVSAIFVLWVMIMLCLDERRRHKDYEEAIESDMSELKRLGYNDADITKYLDEFKIADANRGKDVTDETAADVN